MVEFTSYIKLNRERSVSIDGTCNIVRLVVKKYREKNLLPLTRQNTTF